MANNSKTKEGGLARTQTNVNQKSETNVNKTKNVIMKIEPRNKKISTNRNNTKLTKETIQNLPNCKYQVN